MSSSEILLYQGQGSSDCCTYAINNQLSTYIDDKRHKVRPFKSLYDVTTSPSPKSIHTVIVGGGDLSETTQAFSREMEAFGASFCKALSKYRIAYLGICNGGMLGSKGLYPRDPRNSGLSSEFIQSTIRTMLNIVPEYTIAPLFAPKRISESRDISIDNFRLFNMHIPGKQDVVMPHCLGPAFIDCHQNQDVQTLATFSNTDLPSMQLINRPSHNKPPSSISPDRLSAIIYSSSPFTSTVLLSSVHFEFDSTVVASELFRNSFKDITQAKQAELVEAMKASDASRAVCTKDYFSRLGMWLK